MAHEEIIELLGAYALDAVDADESAAIEDHLRACPRCRAEVAEHRETAAFLAHAGADAPPALWDRISGAIDVPADITPLAPRLGGRLSRRGGTWSRGAAVLASAAALIIAVLGVQLRDQDRRIDQLAAELAASDGGFAAAAADPDTIVELTGAREEQLLVVVDDGRAWLQASALPELDDGRTYQLWGASGDELVSIAVLGRNPGVVSFEVEGYALLAITEEAAPGVVRSANPPLVAGELS